MGVTIGIKTLKYGTVQAGGAPATTLTEIHSLQDSLTFNAPSTTDVDINIDESTQPIYSKTIPSGAMNFVFQIPDVDLDTLADFTGGTVTSGTSGDMYEPPATVQTIKMTIEITPEEGNTLTFNSCAVVANQTGNLGKTNNLNLEVTCTPSIPGDGVSPTYTIATPDYAE